MIQMNIEYPENFLKPSMSKDGTYVGRDKKENWLILLDILEKFKAVCAENGLEWYADGGTLLGAIRHKGFIPWDDDIDIVMPREDYDKYVEICRTSLSYPYVNTDIESSPFYKKLFSRLRRADTTFISTRNDSFFNFCQGVFIDIFPLDDDDPSGEMVRKSIETKKKLNAVRQKYVRKKESEYWKEAKPIYDEYMQSLYENNGKNSGSPQWNTYSTSTSVKVFKKTKANYADGYVEVPFEFTTIRVPAHYEECLVEQFGPNWKTPLKAPSNHACYVRNLRMPYTVYVPKKL